MDVKTDQKSPIRRAINDLRPRVTSFNNHAAVPQPQ